MKNVIIACALVIGGFISYLLLQTEEKRTFVCSYCGSFKENYSSGFREREQFEWMPFKKLCLQASGQSECQWQFKNNVKWNDSAGYLVKGSSSLPLICKIGSDCQQRIRQTMTAEEIISIMQQCSTNDENFERELLNLRMKMLGLR